MCVSLCACETCGDCKENRTRSLSIPGVSRCVRKREFFSIFFVLFCFLPEGTNVCRDKSRLLRISLVHFDFQSLNKLLHLTDILFSSETKTTTTTMPTYTLLLRYAANLRSTTICLMGMDHVGNKPES